MAHTKGPWAAKFDGNNWRVTDQSDWTYEVAIVLRYPGQSAEGAEASQESNAHLIAAAPDMYEALKALWAASGELSADLKKCPEMVGCLIEADAAMAKAEGK